MHHIFEIPEIVLEIVELLGVRDQVCFGQTCKFIWGIAVPFVWRRANADALCVLLPDEAFFYDDNWDECGQLPGWEKRRRLSLSPPVSGQWARLLHYGPLIYRLYISDNEWQNQSSWLPVEYDMAICDPLSVEAICIIGRFPNPRLMFSGLRSLSLRLSYEAPIAASLAFIGPSLEYLDIGVYLLRNEQDRIVYSDPLNAVGGASLRHFRFKLAGVNSRQVQLESQIEGLIKRSPSLLLLSLVVLVDCDTILPLLAALSQLEVLQLTTKWSPTNRGTSIVYPDRAFPSLKALVIMCDRRDFGGRYLPLLGAISSEDLSTLRFPFTNAVNSDVAHAVVELIANKWSQSFKRLILSPKYHGCTFNDIRPLTACRQLERLSVSGSSSIYLMAGDLEQMAYAWPHLQLLAIGCSSNEVEILRDTFPHLVTKIRDQRDEEFVRDASEFFDVWDCDDWERDRENAE